MATRTELTPSRFGLTDWISVRHHQLVGPSWLLSALIHATTLAVFIGFSQSRGCQPDYAGEEGQGFRKVGVYLTAGQTEETPVDQPLEAPTSTPTASSPSAEELPLLDAPPIELERPTDSAKPLLGLGGPPEILSGSSPGPSLETAPLTGPPPTDREVLGRSTSLFGIQDAGKRFVYVLDRSGSMSGSGSTADLDYDALRSAKNELRASLENLDATQQFQVIFYNDHVVRLSPPRSQRSDMFRGIDPHRLDVDRQLGPITAEGGTSHIKALEAALQYNADVIFFLTDADTPGLDTDQLASIRQKNNGGARIHCIEFGIGPDLSRKAVPPNFLRKLAEQNGGTYKYLNVKNLR